MLVFFPLEYVIISLLNLAQSSLEDKAWWDNCSKKKYGTILHKIFHTHPGAD